MKIDIQLPSFIENFFHLPMQNLLAMAIVVLAVAILVLVWKLRK